MNYGMRILLCGFLIFQFLYISWGIFRISISQSCFVLVVCYVFSHLVFCRLIRSRVFGGCHFLVGSLCFAGHQRFGSCVPLCCPLLDPVGLSSPLLFCYCWSIWTLRCSCPVWRFCCLVLLLGGVRCAVRRIIVGCLCLPAIWCPLLYFLFVSRILLIGFC